MKARTKEQNKKALRRAINRLTPLGWAYIGNGESWIFYRGGKTFDLSAADLKQQESIYNEGIFLC